MAEDSIWYPSNWKPREGDVFAPQGIRAVLEGGPLEGRTAHVTDRESNLWIGRGEGGDLIVTDGRSAPSLPPGAELLGRYRFDAQNECLVWKSVTR